MVLQKMIVMDNAIYEQRLNVLALVCQKSNVNLKRRLQKVKNTSIVWEKFRVRSKQSVMQIMN